MREAIRAAGRSHSMYPSLAVVQNNRPTRRRTNVSGDQYVPELEALNLQVGQLLRALKAKDRYTWAHSRRVGAYAAGIARRLEWRSRDVSRMRLAGELHDIGKLGVSNGLLCKQGALTDQEYRMVMEHPVIGDTMLRRLFPRGSFVLKVVRWHHERIDGLGTPDGLIGDEIPLPARIVGVADAFDAMTSARSYRAPLSLDFALDELEANAGAQFDVECVYAMRRLFTSDLEALVGGPLLPAA
ncbi:MAG: HD-GYP domain-containing protein [Gemmatimonadales bacterium]